MAGGHRLVLIVVVACLALSPGCGDAASAPSDAEKAKITDVFGDLLGFCIEEIDSPGGDEFKASDEVDYLISQYRKHKARFKPTPGAPTSSLRKILSSLSTALGNDTCSPRLADRIDRALGR